VQLQLASKKRARLHRMMRSLLCLYAQFNDLDECYLLNEQAIVCELSERAKVGKQLAVILFIQWYLLLQTPHRGEK
jgi:hypothetical protein